MTDARSGVSDLDQGAARRWVPLAEVARPHGVRGELRLRVFNQDSDLLLEIEEVKIEDTVHVVDHARRANDAILLKIRGIDDRDAADALRGRAVCVRRDDFPALEEGEFYACDIEGAEVLLGEARVGVVKELRTYPTVDVLLVSSGEQSWEIPLTETYVERVSAAEERVWLRTLDDLEPV